MKQLAGRLGPLVDRHPVRSVAAVGAAVVALHLWWLQRSRPANTWNADEAGYLADALRFERSALDGLVDGPLSLGPLWDAVTSSANAPLVPLVSVPFVAVLGRSTAAAMVVPPLLHLVASVAVAGIVSHLAAPRRAMVAGLVVLGMPGALLAGRSYVFAVAVAALAACALWALLASDRGRRLWPMLAFGACLGALPLARTMAVAFVPALVVAAALHLRRERAVALHATAALVLALAVALPWWVAVWGSATSYLLDYGYATPAGDYGGGSLADRLVQRLGAPLVDVRPLLAVPGLVWLVASVGRRARTSAAVAADAGDGEVDGGGEVDPDGDDEAGATGDGGGPASALPVWVVVGVGTVALLSTRNSGIWFELPLVVLAAAAVATLTPPSAVLRRRVGIAAVVAAVLNVVLVGVWPIGASWQFAAGDRTGSAAMFLFGDMYQPVTSIRTQDPLLMSSTAAREQVGAAWRSAHEEVVAELEAWRAEQGGLLHLTVTGSGSLMSLNTIRLHQELTQRPADGTSAPDSGAADLGEWLSPSVGVLPRALVVVRSREEAFPLDRDAERVRLAAEADGWTSRAVVDLPDGGDVTVLVPPPGAD